MPDAITTIEDLLDHVTLVSIDLCRLNANRDLDFRPKADAVELEVDPQYALDINTRDDGGGFRVKFATDIKTPLGSIGAEVVGVYSLDGATIDPKSTAALGDFVNNVALMHVLPYSRQAIADLSQRVFGSALLMPIIKRGEISFQVELNDEANDEQGEPHLRD